MAYEYAVDGETYTGRTGRMSSPHLIGTAITVKYNPEDAGGEYGDPLAQYP